MGMWDDDGEREYEEWLEGRESVGWRMVKFFLAVVAVVGIGFISFCAARPSGATCSPLPSCVDVGGVPPCATPTPTVKWDPVADANLEGYRLYDDVGGLLVLKRVIPCVEWIDEETLQSRFYCPGVEIDYPVQRATDATFEFVNWCVKAYKTSGVESVECSNVESICMPPIWNGGAYN